MSQQGEMQTSQVSARHSNGRGRLKVLLGQQDDSGGDAFDSIFSLDSFAQLVRSGRIITHLMRYRDVVGQAPNIDAVPRPLLVAACLKLMSRRNCELRDSLGRVRPVTWSTCITGARRLLRDRRELPQALAGVEARLTALEQLLDRPAVSIPREGPVLCLRTDLWFGVKAGGAVAHTAGIANAFDRIGRRVMLAAFERTPTLRPDVAEHTLAIPQRFWDIPELPAISGNLTIESQLHQIVSAWRPALVYHRLGAFSFAGALVAKSMGLPLIVEYNGSEAWIARNWGRPVRNEALALRIENAVLAAADRVVAVSDELASELCKRGIRRERIRSVMNGVDTEKLHPEIDASDVRERYAFAPGQIVIGFIGSFGVWHGVPVLIDAYARMLADQPDLRDRTRLLLIGDGPGLPAARQQVANLGLEDVVIFTGLVDQERAPVVLSAADVLVAPHVPNTDGSVFFGSPTKLFEYMSLGRCIVASNLAQIGEVLEDEMDSLLVRSGDARSLANALARAIQDESLRKRLGDNARRSATSMHDWVNRVDSILD